MVQMQTYLNVADNSGAKRVQCIKVLGGSHRYVASVGDIIVVASMTTLALSLMPTITHAESVFSDQLPVNFATAT